MVWMPLDSQFSGHAECISVLNRLPKLKKASRIELPMGGDVFMSEVGVVDNCSCRLMMSRELCEHFALPPLTALHVGINNLAVSCEVVGLCGPVFARCHKGSVGACT